MTGDPRDAAMLVDKIRPLLAGYAPEIQGAALAELLAIWLAGHHVKNHSDTRRLRETLLRSHIEYARYFTMVNAQILGTDDAEPIVGKRILEDC
jgi:hypothetical protein